MNWRKDISLNVPKEPLSIKSWVYLLCADWSQERFSWVENWCARNRCFGRCTKWTYHAIYGAQLFIYLVANYLSSGLMALFFSFFPLIVGLIGHVILRTQKLIVLQWMVWQLRLQDSIFVFAYSADSKVNLWGVVMFGIVMYFWKEWCEQYFAKC